jgi:hypothetical protein
MIQITPAIQKMIDESTKIDGVISLQVTKVPQHLIDQIDNINYDYNEVTYFDYLFTTEDKEQVEFAFVVPNSIIDENSYMHLINEIKNLISCAYIRIEDETLIGNDAQFCVRNKCFNCGKTVYYVRPDDYFMVRLDYVKRVLLTPTELQLNLINFLKTVEGVEDIHLEEILHDDIKESVKNDNAIMIVCTAIKNGRRGRLNFALPDHVYDNEENFNSIKNNLIQLLSY